MTNGFKPGERWLDTEGNPIRAHGGGVLYDEGLYYWFGEMRDGFKSFPGISCYTSEDLLNWTYRGIALAPVEAEGHELHPDRIIERPKVIRHPESGRYVMWMHVENKGYGLAHAGVAVSDKPDGPYTYVGSFRPNGAESRDMTLYQDDDGQAYLIHATDNNANLQINLLTADYLAMDGRFKKVFQGQFREAPALFKHQEQYYMIASGCTGFSPNASYYAVSDSIMGEWKVQGMIARGTGRESTFHSQPTYVLTVAGQENQYILMCDRWRYPNLSDSRHVWLPIQFEGDQIYIEWMNSWNFQAFNRGVHIDVAAGPELAVPHGAVLEHNQRPFHGGSSLGELDFVPDKKDLRASAHMTWHENGLVFHIRLIGEKLPGVIEPSNRIWDKDHVWIAVNHYQYSFARLPEGKCSVVTGTYLDYVDIGSSFPADAEQYVTASWSRGEEQTLDFHIEIGRDSADFPLFRQGTELPLSITVQVNSRDMPKERVWTPAGWIWGDPRTYVRARFAE
ncbi:glycoside hydrolase family 43 protein [Paenibacillus swuensis]|uniref:glycoside hydrolase family 43 protein n=1 Tax=Paenibacillus swuensis TaxID=1178515 RepID=UPI0008398D5D|nr:glycoside hydrolase family 43 protein [Paenibacillus swuensis]